MSGSNRNPFGNSAFAGASRAMNAVPLETDFGDPERWGAAETMQVPVPPNPGGVPTTYVRGSQVIRQQFMDLRCRAVDVLAVFEVSGYDDLVGPWEQRTDGFTGWGMELAIGAGMAAVVTQAAWIYAGAYNPWVTTTDRARPVKGVVQMSFPFPAVTLGIVPMFGVPAYDGHAPGALLTVTSTILIAPRY